MMMMITLRMMMMMMMMTQVLDMLYGETPGDLETFVTLSQSNKQFLNRSSSYWLDLIRNCQDSVFIHFLIIVIITVIFFILSFEFDSENSPNNDTRHDRALC